MALKLSILGLKGKIFNDDVDMIVIPGIYGDMSINAVGRDFVHLLTTGVIYVYKGSSVVRRFLIFAGSVLSTDHEIVISVNKDCLDLAKVDKTYFTKAISRYEDLLSEATEETDKTFFQQEIESYKKAQSLVDANYYK